MCGEVIRINASSDLCEECKKEVRYIKEPYCIKCGEQLSDKTQMLCQRCTGTNHNYDRAMGVFVHDGIVKESIYNFKFKNKRINAKYYVDAAIELYQDFFEKTEIDAVIPVPVHKSREQERGYNQAAVFGKQLSKSTGIPYKEDVLYKTEKTKSQKKLSENLRYNNLKKAFWADEDKAKNLKTVLLVDDIYTTGSTVDACAMILKEKGICKVYVLCISRGMDIYYDKKA